ncbi:MAG: hypothetical protein SH817_07110 [Leptospira sp.]|nr:hypothetical protein [Leptospira sp.]
METKVPYPINQIKIIYFLLTATFIVACHKQEIKSTDAGIQMLAGRLIYNGKLFTGRYIEEIPAMEIRQITEYKYGLENGESIMKNLQGQILEKRYYQDGLKVGIHRSWFLNGNDRVYSEFKDGKYVGDRWEWFENGKPAVYSKFDQEGRILVEKKWNRYGKIYMNQVFAEDGSSVGLPGSKNCKPIKSVDEPILK